jgi:hypothetical protein
MIFGEKFYEDELRAQTDTLGISERVDFVGFIPDVDDELRRFDLLVQVSVTADPQATMVLEGMGTASRSCRPMTAAMRSTSRTAARAYSSRPGTPRPWPPPCGARPMTASCA